MIYCIGDSHIINLQRGRPDLFTTIALDTPGTICYRSITAFSVGRETECGFVCQSVQQIPKGSQLVISFGEIDCRHYVPKTAVEKGRTIEEELDDIFGPYALQFAKLLFEYKVAVMSPYCCPEDHAQPDGNKFADIWLAKNHFTSRLKDYCELSGATFIDTNGVVAANSWDLQPYGDGQPFGDSSHLASKFVVPIVMEALGMNAEVSDRRAHAPENTTGANGGSLH
jgi:hypothetical protein